MSKKLTLAFVLYVISLNSFAAKVAPVLKNAENEPQCLTVKVTNDCSYAAKNTCDYTGFGTIYMDATMSSIPGQPPQIVSVLGGGVFKPGGTMKYKSDLAKFVQSCKLSSVSFQTQWGIKVK